MEKIQIINQGLWVCVGILLIRISYVYIKHSLKLHHLKKWLSLLFIGSIMTISYILLRSKYGDYIWILVQLFAVYVLTMLTLHDIKDKTLPLEWLVMGGLFSLLFLVINPNAVFLENLISTLLLAFIMMLISKATRGGVGMGDILALALICLLLGYKNTVMILILSFVFSGCMGLCLYLLKRVNRKSTLPFIPFVLAATLCTIWL